MERAGLPGILGEVAAAAGIDAALQLARARGGRRLYVPARPTAAFVAEIGEAAAQALSELYPRDHITVPLGPTGSVKAARRIADAGIRQGLSVSETARRSGLTERTIYNRRDALERERSSRQMKLFDD